MEPHELPEYEPPTLTSIADEDILDAIGPAQAGSLPGGGGGFV